ncbi:hypothetical protein PhaeoP14_03169 [Phaeobacter piscinae]|nr:hypothetical protein PhaeoP14_03169 [Phaeobacter piscinae]
MCGDIAMQMDCIQKQGMPGAPNVDAIIQAGFGQFLAHGRPPKNQRFTQQQAGLCVQINGEASVQAAALKQDRFLRKPGEVGLGGDADCVADQAGFTGLRTIGALSCLGGEGQRCPNASGCVQIELVTPCHTAGSIDDHPLQRGVVGAWKQELQRSNLPKVGQD